MQRQHQKLAGMLNPELKAFDIFDGFWMFWPMPNILVLQFLGRRKKRGLSLSKARECQKSASLRFIWSWSPSKYSVLLSFLWRTGFPSSLGPVARPLGRVIRCHASSRAHRLHLPFGWPGACCTCFAAPLTSLQALRFGYFSSDFSTALGGDEDIPIWQDISVDRRILLSIAFSTPSNLLFKDSAWVLQFLQMMFPKQHPMKFAQNIPKP